MGSFVRGDLLTEGGCAALRYPCLALTCRHLIQHQQLHLPQIGQAGNVPISPLGALGQRGILSRDLDGPPTHLGGPPRGPFDFQVMETDLIPEYPALWNHNATRERQLTVLPDRYGLLRADLEAKGRAVWAKHASTLHLTIDFSLNSQPLTACVTPRPTLGGTAWPNFKPHKAHHENALLLWLNSSLGLILFWWESTLQQAGKARLKLSRHPDLPVLDTRDLTEAQLEQADMIRAKFEKRTFLPANEAWRDSTRQDLDRCVLIDLLGLPDSILDPLRILR